jgi:uncharacterized protein
VKLWVVGVGLGLTLGASSMVQAFSLPQPEKERSASKLAQIQVRANQGEADAQYLLGLMYLSGRYLVADVELGLDWLSAAAAQEHPKAQQTVADLSFEGKLVKRNLAIAEQWYGQLSAQGNRWAQFRLGFIYSAGGDGVERNCGKAVTHFSAVGDAVSLGNVAWILATCPEAEYRDGHKAVQLALNLLQVDANDPTNLDNLAAAYAELGDFGAAVDAQLKAIAALKQTDGLDMIAEFERRLQNYRHQLPYREVLPLAN